MFEIYKSDWELDQIILTVVRVFNIYYFIRIQHLGVGVFFVLCFDCILF